MGMILLNGQERTPNSPYVEYQETMGAAAATETELREFQRKCRNVRSDAITRFQTSARGQAVYRIGSCFNHSCYPNVQISYDVDNRETLVGVATRAVRAGEELMIAYIDESLSYWQRQMHLYDHYLFQCTCVKCLAESKTAP